MAHNDSCLPPVGIIWVVFLHRSYSYYYFLSFFVQQALGAQNSNQTLFTPRQYSGQSTNNTTLTSNGSTVSPLDKNDVNQTNETPRIGVSGMDVTPSIAEAIGLNDSRGFLIIEIDSGSPAEKAGLREGNSSHSMNVEGAVVELGGDVILSLDNHNITNQDELISQLMKKKVGQNATLTVFRDGKLQEVNIMLGSFGSVILGAVVPYVNPDPYGIDIRYPSNWLVEEINEMNLRITSPPDEENDAFNENLGIFVYQNTENKTRDKIVQEGIDYNRENTTSYELIDSNITKLNDGTLANRYCIYILSC